MTCTYCDKADVKYVQNVSTSHREPQQKRKMTSEAGKYAVKTLNSHGVLIGFVKECVEMAKARILVEGMTQGVGYRAFVKQAARFVKLRGLVRNLEDETVEIFCEGPETKIQEFLKRIRIKGEREDFMSANVTEMKCFWEGESGYRETWKAYRRFEIDYGVEEMNIFQESTLEDREYGKLYFSDLRGDMKGFRRELMEFKENTATSFQTMAEKYGDISNELKKFRKTIEKFFDQFLKERAKKRNSGSPFFKPKTNSSKKLVLYRH